MKILALCAVLCACGGGRPPPPLFKPRGDLVEIDLEAFDKGAFSFAIDGRQITPKLKQKPLANGSLAHGTFGKTGRFVIARVGNSFSGVVRDGKVGFEIVPFAGGHRWVPRSWKQPRPLHGPRWDDVSASRGTPPTVVSTEPAVIDILFAYTEGVLKDRPLDGVKALVAASIQELEDACAIDCPDVTFRSAGIVKTTGTEVASDGTRKDLYTLYYELSKRAPPFKDAHDERAAAHADILVLLVDSVDGGVGLAPVMGEPDTAVAVVDHHGSPWYMAIAHEVGHIMGGMHDDDSRTDPYPFGHAYVGNVRTIMSNPCPLPTECPLVPQWSRPPLGDETSRDVARVIRTTASAVAKFGDQITP